MTVPGKSPARAALASMGLGRLAYWLWFAPVAGLVRSRREGGPWQQWLDRRGRREMMAAASTLPPMPGAGQGAPEVCLLTGRRFWYQTAFCAVSLQRAASEPLHFTLYDDGTFTAALAQEARRLLPGCTIVMASEIERRLDLHLPAARFPALRRQRRAYVHLRKLTDVHTGRSGWRIVLDSDMLFFRRPTALLTWLRSPARPLHMTDVVNSYGYPDATLRAMAGPELPERVNVGICGLGSETIDWGRLESWCAQLLTRHGTSYYLEQALTALLLAGTDAERLPGTDYIVMPGETECRTPSAVAHHYVALSKRGYFRHGWRHICAATALNAR